MASTDNISKKWYLSVFVGFGDLFDYPIDSRRAGEEKNKNPPKTRGAR